MDLRHLHPRQPLHLPRLRRLRHRAPLPSLHSKAKAKARFTGQQSRPTLSIPTDRETNSPHEQEIRCREHPHPRGASEEVAGKTDGVDVSAVRQLDGAGVVDVRGVWIDESEFVGTKGRKG